MIDVEKINFEEPIKEQVKRLEAYKELVEKQAAEQKPVPKILEEIASEICERYCKYPDTWDEEKEGCDLSESDICKNCPLSLLT